jgi:hypothetical protein
LSTTAGADPGVDAEARGQAAAIATCLDIGVPLVAAIIGEGGSGGALALAAGNTVLMLEHAVYSVISPEGCAAILWRDGGHAEDAAGALRLTAQDLFHRRNRARAGGRGASPAAGGDRRAGCGDRSGLGAALRPRRDAAARGAAAKIPGDGPARALSRAAGGAGH